MKVLVVDDERMLADAIAALLRENRYEAAAVYDGKAGLEEAESGRYDLLILDVMLPGMDGCQVTRELRSLGCEIPIIMLTAKGELYDRVSGLECGADYYLPKPFHTVELLACVRALLRRQGVLDNKLTYGNTTLDVSTSILSAGQKSVRLSAREFGLMKALMTSRHRNVTKESLIVKVWGYDTNATENYVEVYASLLRKKLSAIGSDIEICAILRQGYHLEVKKDD